MTVVSHKLVSYENIELSNVVKSSKKGILKINIEGENFSFHKNLAVTFSGDTKASYQDEDYELSPKIKRIVRSSSKIIESNGAYGKCGLIANGSRMTREIGEINKLSIYEEGVFKNNALHGSGFRIEFGDETITQIGRFVNGRLDGAGIWFSANEGYIGKFYRKKSMMFELMKIVSIKDLINESNKNEHLAKLLSYNDLNTIIIKYLKTTNKIEEIKKEEQLQEEAIFELEAKLKLPNLVSINTPPLVISNSSYGLSNHDFISQLTKQNQIPPLPFPKQKSGEITKETPAPLFVLSKELSVATQIHKIKRKPLNASSDIKTFIRKYMGCLICNSKIAPLH